MESRKFKQNERNMQSLQDLLQHPRFGSIVALSQRLRNTNQQLKNLLDDNLAKHCRVVFLDQGTIVLATDSAAWATQIRYQQIEILEKLRLHADLKVNALRCIVQSADAWAKTATTSPAKPLSANTKTHLREMAENISSATLRAALLRLAND